MSPPDDFEQQVNSFRGGVAPAEPVHFDPVQAVQQFTASGQVMNLTAEHLDDGLQSAQVTNDDEITKHAAARAKVYGDTLEQNFPGIDRDKAQQAFQEQLAQHLQSGLLQQHIQNETNYLNSGYFGRRAGIGDIIGKIPGARQGYEIGSAIEMKKAADALQAGKAGPEQYKIVAEKIARDQYDADLRKRLGQGGLGAAGQTAWDVASQLPAEVAEWMAFTGPSKVAGAVGAEGAAKLGGGGVSQAAAEYVTRLAARQALSSYKIAPEVLKAGVPQVRIEDGKVETASGQDMTDAFKKTWLSQLYSNAAFEASGSFEPKAGGGMGAIGLSAAKAIGATQAASEASYRLGGGGQGSVLTQLGNATTDDEKRQILAHFAVESGVFGLLETGMHSEGNPKHESPKPADVIESMKVRLQDEGIPPNAWDSFIANTIAKTREGQAQATKAEAARDQLKESDVPVADREGLVADQLGLTPEQKQAWLKYPKYPLGSEVERRTAKAPEKPALPTTPPESVTAPQEPETAPRPSIYHIADYKQPGNSANKAMEMLDHRTPLPYNLRVWEGENAKLRHDANIPEKGVSLEFDQADFTHPDLGGTISQGDAAKGIPAAGPDTAYARSPIPPRYDPSLKQITYKGSESDPAFGRLKAMVDQINAERTNPKEMEGREYPHAMPPVDLVATGGKVEGRVETGPGQSRPQSPTENASQYADRMREAVTSKGLNPEVIEKVVAESGASNAGEWEMYAEENDVPFRKNSTAMRYAGALLDHEAEAMTKDMAANPEANDIKTIFDNAGLNPKERHVLWEMARMGSTMEAAGKDISLKDRQGVDYHFRNALKKLGLTRKQWNDYVKTAARDQDGEAAFGELSDTEGQKERDRLTAHQQILSDIQSLNRNYDKAARGGKLTPDKEQEFNEQLQELHSRLDDAGAIPAPGDDAGPSSVRRAAGGIVPEGVQEPPAAPAPPSAAEPQQATPPAGSAQAPSAGPADAGPPVAPTSGGEAPGGFLTDPRGSLDIDKLLDFAHGLFRKFVPETEAPDETAEVQAAAREAAKVGGLSKSAADTAAQALIAEINAKAHKAALDQFANELRGQAGSTGEPTAGPAGAAAARQSLGDRLQQSVGDFLRDERGYLDPAVLGAYATNLIDRARAFGRGIGDELDKLSSKSFPATTRLARVVGEKLSQFINKDVFVHEAVPRYIDKAFGEKATPEEINLHWTTMAEERLRYGKQAFLAKSAEGSAEAAAARQQAATLRQQAAAATDPAIAGALRHQASLADKAATDGAQKATEYQQKAGEVSTMIGPDSPLKSEADYQATLNSPEYKATLGAGGSYEKQVVPDMDRNFKMATGMDENDQIDTLTQLPGRPMNLMMKDAEIGGTGPGAGNPKNLKIQKYAFAREASLNGEYETDGAKSLENTFNRGYGAARKADAYRTAEANGIGQWAQPGQQIEGFKELPFTKPPTGTQNAQPGDVFYVHDDAYSEWRQALSIDEPFKIPAITQMSNSLSWIALRSTVEAAYHVRNLLTILTKPGVNPIDLFKNGMKIFKGDPATADQLVELARIGAGKEHIDGSAANPLLWSRKFLDFADKVTRLTANDAFDNLKKMGHDAETTETARRDFINQIAGQYNTRAQSKVVAWLRSTGIGPFATAGMNYYMNGLKSLILDPGVKAESWKGALALRTEVMARQAVLLGTVALVNYLAWRRADGDDSTPLGSIKTGAGPDGKTRYFDFASLMSPIPRGMRETGLAALTEGVRRGQPTSAIADKAKWDAVEAAIHPILGPPGQFAYTAVTGKNTLGMKVAEPSPPGGSDSWQNLKAAVMNANPAVGSLTGANAGAQPDTTQPPGERVLRRTPELAGPFNPMKERNNPVVSDFYDQLQRAQAAHQQATQQKQRGLATPNYGPNEMAQYRRLTFGEQRLVQLNKAMRAAKDDATRARIRALQVQIASQALGR